MTSIALVAAGWLVGCSAGGPGGGKDGDGTGTSDPDAPYTGPWDPNRVVLHRLNRTEYDNTVRDLLGTAQTPAREFPPDDLVGGFDNIASNLSISPLHLELYELAAQSLATEVLSVALAETLHLRGEGEGEEVTATAGGSSGNAWNLWSNGDVVLVFDAPADGRYTLTTRVWADQAGPDLAQMQLGHDGFGDLTTDVTATNSDDGQLFSVDVVLSKGVHTAVVSFVNDYWDPATYADRNLYVDFVDVQGPTDVTPGPNPLRERWVTCDPEAVGEEACLEEVVRGFLPKAWRRSVSDADVSGLMALGDTILADGGTFDDALYWSFVSALISPHFLYRVELDPDPTSVEPHPLGDYEVANRLSYFLWSSMPDDELFAAAAAGELQDSEQVEAQVRRMLLDDRAQSLVDNFGGQWLYIRGVTSATKDSVTYPEFDAELTASMEEEMTRFFSSFVFGGRDLRELLTADEGEIDARLADHYGLPFSGNGWKQVSFAGTERGGLLGQAGLLTVTAYPARTSPVIRGKFVLGQLMCDEPPPPPPGVEGLDDAEDAITVRDQLEQHRANPVCASCHETMDELGFALEKYDAIGAWRTEDRGLPIDDSAKLPDGTAFQGREELGELVAADPKFATCVSEKLMSYAIGRLPEESDEPFIAQIADTLREGGFTFESLAVAVATNPTFRLRRGEP